MVAIIFESNPKSGPWLVAPLLVMPLTVTNGFVPWQRSGAGNGGVGVGRQGGCCAECQTARAKAGGRKAGPPEHPPLLLPASCLVVMV